MNAGELDRRVTILTYAPTTDALGGVTEDWTDGSTVWCSRKDQSGREFLAAGQTEAQHMARFKLRWGVTITAKDRLRCEGVEYDILNINELDRRAGIEITAQARV